MQFHCVNMWACKIGWRTRLRIQNLAPWSTWNSLMRGLSTKIWYSSPEYRLFMLVVFTPASSKRAVDLSLGEPHIGLILQLAGYDASSKWQAHKGKERCSSWLSPINRLGEFQKIKRIFKHTWTFIPLTSSFDTYNIPLSLSLSIYASKCNA